MTNTFMNLAIKEFNSTLPSPEFMHLHVNLSFTYKYCDFQSPSAKSDGFTDLIKRKKQSQSDISAIKKSTGVTSNYIIFKVSAQGYPFSIDAMNGEQILPLFKVLGLAKNLNQTKNQVKYLITHLLQLCKTNKCIVKEGFMLLRQLPITF